MSKVINTKYILTNLPSFFPSPANTIFPLTDVESVTDVPSSSVSHFSHDWGEIFWLKTLRAVLALKKAIVFYQYLSG